MTEPEKEYIITQKALDDLRNYFLNHPDDLMRIAWKNFAGGIRPYTSAEKVLDFINARWVREYCKVEIKSNTERWERFGRPKNDAYINGSHSGYIHALQDLQNLLDRIERIEHRQQERDR